MARRKCVPLAEKRAGEVLQSFANRLARVGEEQFQDRNPTESPCRCILNKLLAGC